MTMPSEPAAATSRYSQDECMALLLDGEIVLTTTERRAIADRLALLNGQGLGPSGALTDISDEEVEMPMPIYVVVERDSHTGNVIQIHETVGQKALFGLISDKLSPAVRLTIRDITEGGENE
jgi:hypothetical protein